jgi:polyhydroxyalkanoate synthase subunit PhaC
LGADLTDSKSDNGQDSSTTSRDQARETLTAMSAAGHAALEMFHQNMTAFLKHSSTIGQAAKPADAMNTDPFHVQADAAKVMTALASHPEKIMAAQADLYQRYFGVWSEFMASDAKATPSAPDKRFRGADWEDHPYFKLLKQSYLTSSDWLMNVIESADDVDAASRKKVAFFTRQLADAFSPTNFAMTNPEVMRLALETSGESLRQGYENFLADLERGGGRLAIQQTDFSVFKVGENVATTPGSVVARTEMFEIIHYAPTTKTTYEIPLLIFPPWINKFYILDLQPENSMVRWLTQQGYSVFLVSWVNPDRSFRDKTFDDYMTDGILRAVDLSLQHSGASKVNTVGYCIGGTLLASTLALMGQEGDERINSATFFAAQTDFSEAGDLLMLVDDEWMDEIERRMEENGGVLDGQSMADTFNMLRANDLIWSFFVSNYLKGQKPKAFDLLYWNSDQTNLPQTLHLYYLDQFYRQNALARGMLQMAGKKVSLKDIRVPCMLQASRDDHIAPYASVYKGARQFGGPTRFVMSGSGHIAGVINHPDAQKYQHWINDVDPLPADVTDWIAGAEEHKGSWWPTWDQWLSERSGPRRDALTPENGGLEVMGPAPGEYVKKSFRG